ncbi:MAG: hypothetical protein UHD05_08420, partial [Ruminococcus sp.]|nr:hypothetical protein [Ruminococcus sp.]
HYNKGIASAVLFFDIILIINPKTYKIIKQNTTDSNAKKWYYITTGTTPEAMRTRGDSVEISTYK